MWNSPALVDYFVTCVQLPLQFCWVSNLPPHTLVNLNFRLSSIPSPNKLKLVTP